MSIESCDNKLKPLNAERLGTNRVVQASMVFMGDVVDTFQLRVARVNRSNDGKVFTLEDLLGRRYEVPAADVNRGMYGSMLRFDGVVEGRNGEDFKMTTEHIKAISTRNRQKGRERFREQILA